MIAHFKRKMHEYIHYVARIKTTPHEIALGFAVGTLIGVLPTPGFGFLLALLVILVYKKISKISLFGALLFWNPLVTLPITGLSYKLGSIIFGSEPAIKFDIVLLNQIYNFSRRYLVGNFIIAVFFSAFGYVLIYLIVRYYRKRFKIE